MPTLQADDLADLVAMTLNDMGPMKWTDISTDIQEHVALPRLMKKNRVGFRAGPQIEWNVQVTHSNAARNVGLYERDNVNVGDVMKKAKIDWRHSTVDYAFERREISFNREPARIVSLLKIRRADAMIALAEKMEDNFWSCPSTSSNEVDPHGVPYWIVWSDNSGTNPTGGFDGGAPTGHSLVANLDPATYTRWKNWCAKYTNVSKTDLVRKWRKAATFTKFKAPTEIPEYNTGSRYGYYTNYTVIGQLEEVLEAQNDNLGKDVASMDGALQFRKNPVIWVPKLETHTPVDAIYGINWGVFKTIFLKGEYMREDGPSKVPGMHNTMQVFIDLTYNWELRNRRLCFVLAKSAS